METHGCLKGRLMKYAKQLFVIFLYMFLLTGCFTEGPKIYIETDKLTDDFVVECVWGSVVPSLFHGSRKVGKRKFRVTTSGVDFECGSALGVRPYVMVSHPLYFVSKDCKSNDCVEDKTASGSIVFKTKDKLTVLDEYEKKFNDGYWEKNLNPGFRYASSVSICGSPYAYLDLHKAYDKKKDKYYFKEKYSDEIKECYRRIISVYEKYDANRFKYYKNAELYMDKMWNNLEKKEGQK